MSGECNRNYSSGFYSSMAEESILDNTVICNNDDAVADIINPEINNTQKFCDFVEHSRLTSFDLADVNQSYDANESCVNQSCDSTLGFDENMTQEFFSYSREIHDQNLSLHKTYGEDGLIGSELIVPTQSFSNLLQDDPQQCSNDNDDYYDDNDRSATPTLDEDETDNAELVYPQINSTQAWHNANQSISHDSTTSGDIEIPGFNSSANSPSSNKEESCNVSPSQAYAATQGWVPKGDFPDIPSRPRSPTPDTGSRGYDDAVVADMPRSPSPCNYQPHLDILQHNRNNLTDNNCYVEKLKDLYDDDASSKSPSSQIDKDEGRTDDISLEAQLYTSEKEYDSDENDIGTTEAAGQWNDSERNQNAEFDDNIQDNQREAVGRVIANIFGESDESDTETGEKQLSTLAEEGAAANVGDDSDDDIKISNRLPDGVEYDFDVIMRQKKIERRMYRSRRRHANFELINDNDDVISDLIDRMKVAASDDRQSNEQRRPALAKRKLLPSVLHVLRKRDLQTILVENGVITAMAEWLSPLPDRSLPSLEIRTEFLKSLASFPPLEADTLKHSNLGKAIMYLYKHPRETKENKLIAGKLISEWARPIFNLQSDFRALSKEEREQRDYEHMPKAKRRRLSMETGIENDDKDGSRSPSPDKKESTGTQDDNELLLRPGQKGWIGRARVPKPSTRDYVVRPKWNIEGEYRYKKGSDTKKVTKVIERKMREFKTRNKQQDASHAINISVNGAKMAI